MATPFAVLRRFAVGELITLYEVDLSALGGTVYYFTNNIFDNRIPIKFNGNVYTHIPCDMDGIEVGNDTGPAQPKFRLATAGGPIASLIATYRDLRGAKVWRKKTFAEFLDQMPSDELVVNGTFNTDASGWTGLNGTTASVGGKLRLTATASGVAVQAYQIINTVIGQTYSISIGSIGAISGSPTGIRLWAGTSQGTGNLANLATSGGSATFVATTTTTYITAVFVSGAVGNAVDYDTISVKAADGSMGIVSNPSADPTAIVSKELYVVDRKLAANPTFAEFQLVSPMDQEGVEIPLRIVRKRWCDRAYRQRDGASWLNFDPVDGGCPYRGTNYFTEDDQPTVDPALDKCSKLLTGCKKRFGNAVGLPFSGFPGVRGAGEA